MAALPNPPATTSGPDEEQLRLKAVFHYVVALPTPLFTSVPFIHLAMGEFTLIVLSPSAGDLLPM